MGGLFCRLPAETKWSNIWHMSGVVSPRRQWIFIMIKNMNCIWNEMRETGEFQSWSSCHIEMFFTFGLPHNFTPILTLWSAAPAETLLRLYPIFIPTLQSLSHLFYPSQASWTAATSTPYPLLWNLPIPSANTSLRPSIHIHVIWYSTHTLTHTRQQACCRWRQQWR